MSQKDVKQLLTFVHKDGVGGLDNGEDADDDEDEAFE